MADVGGTLRACPVPHWPIFILISWSSIEKIGNIKKECWQPTTFPEVGAASYGKSESATNFLNLEDYLAIFQMDSTVPFGEQAEASVKVNFLDTVNVCDILFPILKPHARYVSKTLNRSVLVETIKIPFHFILSALHYRVVHVSSMASTYSLSKCSGEIKDRFLNTKTIQEVKDIVQEFVE